MPDQHRRAPGDDGHIQGEQNRVVSGPGPLGQQLQGYRQQRIGGQLQGQAHRPHHPQNRHRPFPEMDQRPDGVSDNRRGHDRPGQARPLIEALRSSEPARHHDEYHATGHRRDAGGVAAQGGIAEPRDPPDRAAGDEHSEECYRPGNRVFPGRQLRRRRAGRDGRIGHVGKAARITAAPALFLRLPGASVLPPAHLPHSRQALADAVILRLCARRFHAAGL